MENKIYVVISEFGYDYERGNTNIVGVFTNKEEAEKIVKERKDNIDDYICQWDYYSIWMEEKKLNKLEG